MPASQTLAALAGDLRSGRTTAEALTRACLERASDPAGEGARSFITLYGERALAQARATDSLRAAGVLLSPVMGIPVSIKDLFDVAGEVTCAGSTVLRESAAATRDAVAVERVKRAGMVIIGRTNMVEFAYSGLGLNPHYGTPRNPWDRSTGRIPGGSSSGAAISVTDSMSAAAIGTDTGGSVRIPAALCGLTGFKPTARRVDLGGALPLATSFDSIGPLARSVACCEMLDAILSGTPTAPGAPLATAGLRFLVPGNVVQDDLDGAVSTAFERALERLAQAGALVVVQRVAEIDRWIAAPDQRSGLASAEAFAWHRELIGQHEARYDARVAQRILRGAAASAADFIGWQAERRAWIATMELRLAGFDAMLTPTVACVAPPLAPLESDDALYARTNQLVLRNTRMINYLDGCALTLPCHRTGDAPVGLMVSGPAGADRRILAVGAAVERTLG